MKKILLFSLFVLAAGMTFANTITCTIKNIHQPNQSKNVIEFDVYLKSTSSQPLKFQAFQAGIDFNYDGLANGGVITGEFVKNSGDKRFSGNQVTPNWNINPITKQIRLLAAIQPSNVLAAPIPEEGIKLGTFRMTNTVPFGSATPNFKWTFQVGHNLTKSTVTAFVNSNKTGKVLTTQTDFSYDKQGPEYFVEGNPMINSKPADVVPVKTIVENVSVYPNPVQEFVKIDISSTQNDNITLKLIDNTGRVVKQVQEDINVGDNTLTVNMKEMAIGTYALQIIKSNNTMITKQVVKK